MIGPASLADLATQAGYDFQRGPEALAEHESTANACAARAQELQAEAEKAIKELANLAKLESANREARARLRVEQQKDTATALDSWRLGGKDDFAKQAERFASQGAQILWLTERDAHCTNVLRPRLRLTSLRADIAFFLAGAETMFAQAAVAAYNRHAALQQAIAVDGVAQLPESEGKANTLWRQATALMGRAAEISASADRLETQIGVREAVI
ncbi:MAG TPA: hypothetical protein VHY84_01675 [Bryobacteraceae bacterium]|jgi:hypothetical protein|nr:hypothetical protein [Bryobacteraceae bacterium]